MVLIYEVNAIINDFIVWMQNYPNFNLQVILFHLLDNSRLGILVFILKIIIHSKV